MRRRVGAPPLLQYLRNRPWLTRMAVALASLGLSLGLLEGGLRLAGRFYYRQHTGGLALTFNHSFRQGKDNVVVMTLGDSYTFGGSGRSQATYPAALSRLLNRPGDASRFDVINGGVCGNTSRDVRAGLEPVISVNSPDVVVLLVGAANRFDPVPYSEDFMSPADRLREGVFDLRIVKMLRNMRDAIIEKLGCGCGRPLPGDGQERGNAQLRGIVDEYGRLTHAELLRREAALTARLAGPLDAGGRTAALLALGWVETYLRRQSAAEARFQTALQLDQKSETVRMNAFQYYFRLGLLTVPVRSERVRYLFEAMRLYPPVLGYDRFYRLLLKEYAGQSVYDAATVARELEGMRELKPFLRREPLLALHIRIFQNKRLWDRQQDEWLEGDLSAIAERLELGRIRLVLATYPLPYAANAVIRKVAQDRALPLVDLEPVFSKLIAGNKGDRAPYILDDDHCTDLGHRIMAENVRKVLSERLFPDLDALRRHGGGVPVGDIVITH